eukprot:3370079-Rhodomonas_salina.3
MSGTDLAYGGPGYGTMRLNAVASPLWPYAFAMRCPVLTCRMLLPAFKRFQWEVCSPIVLGMCYSRPGPEIAFTGGGDARQSGGSFQKDLDNCQLICQWHESHIASSALTSRCTCCITPALVLTSYYGATRMGELARMEEAVRLGRLRLLKQIFQVSQQFAPPTEINHEQPRPLYENVGVLLFDFAEGASPQPYAPSDTVVWGYQAQEYAVQHLRTLFLNDDDNNVPKSPDQRTSPSTLRSLPTPCPVLT